MWFIGVEVEQETSAPPPKKNPGSAPVKIYYTILSITTRHYISIWETFPGISFPFISLDQDTVRR